MLKRTVDTGLSERKNNFDFLRFLAATLVIFSHSWPLTQGTNSHEPLEVLTGKQLDFGALAVYIFFIISGFLIAMSFDRTQSLGRFAKARFLRIAPALVIVVVFLAAIVGPIDTTLTQSAYWSSFPFLGFVADHLPGVFVHNPYSGAVDGSLWTIKFEVLCYALVALMGVLKLLTNRWVLAVFLLCSMTPWAGEYSAGLLPYFAVGMFFYGFRRVVPIRGTFAIAAALVLVAAFVTHHVGLVLPFSLAYLVLWFAFTPSIPLQNFARYGDWSYGLYIWAFPVQQQWMQAFPGLSPITLFLLSLPTTWVLSVLSWNLIEKRALALKGKILLSGGHSSRVA